MPRLEKKKTSITKNEYVIPCFQNMSMSKRNERKFIHFFLLHFLIVDDMPSTDILSYCSCTIAMKLISNKCISTQDYS